MFDDFEDESADVTADSPDRAIVWAVHARGDAAGLTPEEAWAILHERYPDEPRFLLLHAYAELVESRKQADAPAATNVHGGVWTPAYFLTKIEHVLRNASPSLHAQLRDLLLFGGAILAGAKGDDLVTLALLRSRVEAEDADATRDDRDRAGLRLRRFERELVRELHDRTEEGKPLGVRASAAPPAAPTNDWASMVASAKGPSRRYVPTERFSRGELVEHPKFGKGLVTGIEPGKVVLLFESGSRKLVAGG